MKTQGTKVKLGQILTLEYGQSLPDSKRIPGSVGVYGSNGLVGTHAQKLLDGPGIVVGRKGSIGKVAWSDGAFWPIDTTYYVKTEQDLRYVYYLLSHLGLDKYNRASGVPGLNRDDVYAIEISLPDKDSQKKIASSLEIIDLAISTTQKVIKQDELVKKTLIRQLPTRGIGHTNFKNSELGKIPEAWRVVKLDDVAKRGTGHTPNKKVPEYYNGNIKWVSLTDSKKLDNGLIWETERSISILGIKNSSAVVHPKDTVILSRDAGVGMSAIMADDMAVSQHFITWTCGPELDNWYLYYHLQMQKPVFEKIATGSTIKTIGMPFFKALAVPLPPLDEQRRIVSILRIFDELINMNIKTVSRWLELRAALMKRLLSGEL